MGQPMVDAFKNMLAHFPRVYACPYCRHHMTTLVFRSLEPELYPLEWSLLGRPEAAKGTVSLETEIMDKVSTITDASSLQIFIWKLHNAVNSSIDRQEAWYQRNNKALYTNRFWPSIEAELKRSKTMHLQTIPIDRIESIHNTMGPSTELRLLKQTLLRAIKEGRPELIEEVQAMAEPIIKEHEQAVRASGMLSRFSYNPHKGEQNPGFSEEEANYARGGLFQMI